MKKMFLAFWMWDLNPCAGQDLDKTEIANFVVIRNSKIC